MSKSKSRMYEIISVRNEVQLLWKIKPTKGQTLVSEIDTASDMLDRVIGSVMYGMDPEEASNWFEYEAGDITNTLDKV